MTTRDDSSRQRTHTGDLVVDHDAKAPPRAVRHGFDLEFHVARDGRRQQTWLRWSTGAGRDKQCRSDRAANGAASKRCPESCQIHTHSVVRSGQSYSVTVGGLEPLIS